MGCFGIRYVKPEMFDDVHITTEVTQLASGNYKLKVSKVPHRFYVWLVTFKTRRTKPTYISGPKLYKKTHTAEALDESTDMHGRASLPSSPQNRIDNDFKGVVSVVEVDIQKYCDDENYDPSSDYYCDEMEYYYEVGKLHHYVELELDASIAQKTYLYIDDKGNVMDGGYRYVIDIPAFVDDLIRKA
jgi:hypothetical protein